MNNNPCLEKYIVISFVTHSYFKLSHLYEVRVGINFFKDYEIRLGDIILDENTLLYIYKKDLELITNSGYLKLNKKQSCFLIDMTLPENDIEIIDTFQSVEFKHLGPLFEFIESDFRSNVLTHLVNHHKYLFKF